MAVIKEFTKVCKMARSYCPTVVGVVLVVAIRWKRREEVAEERER